METNNNHATPVQNVENGSSTLRFIFFGLAFLVAVILVFQFKNSNEPKPYKNTGDINPSSETETQTPNTIELPFKPGEVYTIHVKSTDSIMVKGHVGYRLVASTGGSTEKPIPYFRNNGDGWKEYGNGKEELNGTPSFEVWFKGADSATSTRIWYWYEKI